MKTEKNPFKETNIPEQEVPADLKDKVLGNVNALKLLLDVTSLFTSNYLETIEQMFKTKPTNDSDTDLQNKDTK